MSLSNNIIFTSNGFPLRNFVIACTHDSCSTLSNINFKVVALEKFIDLPRGVGPVSNCPLQRVVLARIGSVCSRIVDKVSRVSSCTARGRRPVGPSTPPETRGISL